MSKTEGHERVPEELKIVPAKFQVNPTSFVRVTMGGDTFGVSTCTTVIPVVHRFVCIGGKHGLLALGTNEHCQTKLEKWTLGIESKSSILSAHVRFELVPFAYDHACRAVARCLRMGAPLPICPRFE